MSQADVGERTGPTSVELEEVKRLKRENRDLREANDILKAADPERRCPPWPPQDAGGRTILHSESGSQFRTNAFLRVLKNNGITGSRWRMR